MYFFTIPSSSCSISYICNPVTATGDYVQLGVRCTFSGCVQIMLCSYYCDMSLWVYSYVTAEKAEKVKSTEGRYTYG